MNSDADVDRVYKHLLTQATDDAIGAARRVIGRDDDDATRVFISDVGASVFATGLVRLVEGGVPASAALSILENTRASIVSHIEAIAKNMRKPQ